MCGILTSSTGGRLIKKEFPEIRKQLWKEYFWSRSYCLITTADASIYVVRKYIQNQGMKWGEEMLKAYKYRLYPNKEEQIYLAKTFGCTRFIYNQMLANRIKAYE